MKKILSKFICAVTAVFSAVCLLSVPSSAAYAKLDKTNLRLPAGYSSELKVSGTKKDVSWTSSDESVVSVKSSDGSSAKIVGNKTGTAYIYAKADGADLKCRVTVKKSFISADMSDIELPQGGTRKITFTVKGSKKIMYKIEDTDICSASWGKWNGNKITLTVKSKAAGSTEIKVYRKGFAKTTAETVQITVNGGSSVKNDVSGGGAETDNTDGSGVTAEQIINAVNAEREKAGLKPLKSDPALNAMAAQRADEITDVYSHDRPDGSKYYSIFEENDFSYGYSGENIARGQRSTSEVMNSWMSSPNHKANILNSNYTKIGAAVRKNSSGKYCWVQLFTN